MEGTAATGSGCESQDLGCDRGGAKDQPTFAVATFVVSPEWPAQAWFQNLMHATVRKWAIGSARDVWLPPAGEPAYPNWPISLFFVAFTNMRI